MAESTFRGIIVFFDKLGVYDVLLPFLLIFTIVFGILEKSKILGVQKGSNGQEWTKKNLNAMVAFVIAFIAIASSQIVGIINQGLMWVSLLLIIVVSFLILIGAFLGEDWNKAFQENKVWKQGALISMLLGVIVIFLNAITNSRGDTWLEVFWDWLTNAWSSTVAGSIILVIVILAFMFYIVREPKNTSDSD